MAWLFGIVVLLLLIFVPAFRAVALGLFAILIIGGFVWWGISKSEETASLKRITHSELDLMDFRFGSSGDSSHQISGRIRNRSPKYTLRNLGLKIVVSDCTVEEDPVKQSCDVVGQNEENIYLSIPPGQVRDFSESVYFSPHMKIRGRMTWYYSVTAIKGE